MSKSIRERLAGLPRQDREAWLADQPPDVLSGIHAGAWWFDGRPEQFPPPGPWFLWLILSGRGWGKTRTGSEYLIDRAEAHPIDRHGNPTEWLVIGETLADTRTFCIDGPSGIRAALRRRGYQERTMTEPVNREYKYVKAPKPLIVLGTGQRFYFEGCDDEDTGRGYNAAGAWLDELAKWRYTEKVWIEGIMPSIRADLVHDHPRVVVTTTPKPITLLRSWVRRARQGDQSFQLTVGSTFDNATNLSPHTLAELQREYAGTTIGRQELGGELLEEVDGALWSHVLIEKHRVRVDVVPPLRYTVVGMDPAGTGTGDLTGLVAVGRGTDDDDYVLRDWSARIVGRTAALKAWELVYHVNADLLVFEDNFGKKWLEQVLADAYHEVRDRYGFPTGGAIPMRGVTALHGKRLRAEPYAMRYEQGRVHHITAGLTELEDEMCSWVPDDDPDSPDRVDALVHAGMWLKGRERGRAQLAVPTPAAIAQQLTDSLPLNPYDL